MIRKIRITTASSETDHLDDLIEWLQKIKQLKDGAWINVEIEGKWRF
jgi:hypothetical protein